MLYPSTITGFGVQPGQGRALVGELRQVGQAPAKRSGVAKTRRVPLHVGQMISEVPLHGLHLGIASILNL
jgi:hypothetical protein